jgi:hypothetical protein
VDHRFHQKTLLILAIVTGILIWNYHRPADRPAPQTTEKPGAAFPPPASLETPPPATAMFAPPSHLPATPAPSAALVLPGSSSRTTSVAEDISEELSAVDSTIRSFQAVHGENPIGSNAEITSALLGNNLKQIKLEVPVGSQINGDGQMCDRWGTPYFFHQVSATETEIRSAGPDRQMWTGDDSQM